MNASTPRIGIAALALAVAAAVTIGPALLAGSSHPLAKSHGEVSIAQLTPDQVMPIANAPASGKAIETITVEAKR
ncbi:MAG: hypothetical protein ACRETU_01585 [Steroidobacterales bacterium]